MANPPARPTLPGVPTGGTATTTATTAPPNQPAGAPPLPAPPGTPNVAGPYGLGALGTETLQGSGTLFYGSAADRSFDVTLDEAITTFLHWAPAQQAQIQQWMLQAGFYPKGTVPLPGHLDSEDLKAFTEAAKMARLTSTPVGTYLESGATQGGASGMPKLKLGVIQPGVVQPGVVGGGSHYVVHLTNPDEANFIADRAARAILGENASPEEKAKIYAAISGQERSEQGKVNAATEDERKAVFAAKSMENTSQFNARVAENTSKFNAQVTERDQQFASSLGGTGGPGGGIVSTAQQFMGVPYKWGGTDAATGMDCSGFTQAILAKNGIKVGRDTSAQVAQGAEVGKGVGDLGNAQPGDLVFFGDKAGDHAHVGIYVGNGQMVSEPHSGSGVRVDDVAGWSASGERLYSIRRYTSGSSSGGVSSGGAGGSAINTFDAAAADTTGAKTAATTGTGRTPDVQLPNQRLPDQYIPAVSTEAVQAPSAAAVADKELRAAHPVEAGISDVGLNSYATMLSILRGGGETGGG